MSNFVTNVRSQGGSAALLYTYNYANFNTGINVSYVTGDDKNIRDTVINTEINTWPSNVLRPRLFPQLNPTDPTLLSFGVNPDGSGNNIFGNKNRFTDELGGTTYAKDLVIDHFTGWMIKRTIISVGNSNGETACNTNEALVFEGFSDWFTPNAIMILSILNPNGGFAGTFGPFDFAFTNRALWTSTKGNNFGWNFAFNDTYGVTNSSSDRTGSTLSFRKAFTYNSTTKQMELS